MDLEAILSTDAIQLQLKLNSKKQLLNLLAEKGEDVTDVPADKIFTSLMERERLGSTGLGDGVAIPHARLPELKKIHGIFVSLETPVDFDAVDNMPVDLIFTLLAPEEAGAEHLRTLAQVSRLFRDGSTCDKLRGCQTVDAAYVLLTQDRINNAA